MPKDSPRFLVAAGFVTWAVTRAPTLLSPQPVSALWILASLVFVIAFFFAAKRDAPSRRTRTFLLVLQSVAALVTAYVGPSGFDAILLVVVAGEAPMVIGARPAAFLVAAQTLSLAGVLLAVGQRHSLTATGAYFGFQLFALGAARLAQRESEARAELARINAELMATRELFADATRSAERLRIARDLHDALGHHLTGLAIHLEVAKNADGEEQRAAVTTSQKIAKDLLAQIREVVSSMREDQPIDLTNALRTLVAGLPRPRVHLTLPKALHVRDAALGHVVFRCVQEALTNAVRHAAADNVWIDLADDAAGTLVITARDDGAGAEIVNRGHGLNGLTERVVSSGGRVEIDSKPGQGFTLRASLPYRGEA